MHWFRLRISEQRRLFFIQSFTNGEILFEMATLLSSNLGDVFMQRRKLLHWDLPEIFAQILSFLFKCHPPEFSDELDLWQFYCWVVNAKSSYFKMNCYHYQQGTFPKMMSWPLLLCYSVFLQKIFHLSLLYNIFLRQLWLNFAVIRFKVVCLQLFAAAHAIGLVRTCGEPISDLASFRYK